MWNGYNVPAPVAHPLIVLAPILETPLGLNVIFGFEDTHQFHTEVGSVINAHY